MIERISFLIALVLVSGCAPDKYIVRNVDTDYLLNQINPEQLACIGSIPINLANEIPYGLQESVDQRTKEPDPLVLVDSRAVIGGLIRSAEIHRDHPCNHKYVETFLVKTIKNEFKFDLDTGEVNFTSKILASVVIHCKNHKQYEAIMVGTGPLIGGGFLGGFKKRRAALVRSTTYAVYDLLSKVQEICKDN